MAGSFLSAIPLRPAAIHQITNRSQGGLSPLQGESKEFQPAGRPHLHLDSNHSVTIEQAYSRATRGTL